MKSLVAVVLLSLHAVTGAGRNVTLPSQCSCGFRDFKTGELYTESIIVYFNETAEVDQDVFKVLDYKHKNQRGWNTVFPQGARPENVRIGNNGSEQWQNYIDGDDPRLEMILDPFRFDHLSNGAEIQSVRRDIMYGTFRSEMRSAPPWVGGSAMSMFLKYNDSQSAEIDLLNMNSAYDSRVLQIVNGEWPSYRLATNYSLIQDGQPPKIPARSPYTFMDLKVDWTNDTIDFWINNNRSRHINKEERTLPTTPQTLHFAHWSTGDSHYMQGPPMNGSIAQVKYVRAFFNTSMMTAADHRKYDQQCNMVKACSVDDLTLRGSTKYSAAATTAWKPLVPNQHLRDAAGYVAAAFSVIGIVSLINALIRRGPWHSLKNMALPGSKRASTQALRKSLRESIGVEMKASYNFPHMAHLGGIAEEYGSGFETPAPGYTSQPSYIAQYSYSGSQTPLPEYESRKQSPWQSMQSIVTPKRSLKSMSSRRAIGHMRSTSAPEYLRPKTSRGTLGGDPSTPTMERPPPTFHMARQRVEEEEDEDYRVTLARNQAYLDLAGGRVEDEIHPVSPNSRSVSHSPEQAWYDAGDEKHESFMDLDDEEEVAIVRKVSFKNKREAMIVEVPDAPQDISAAKIMKEKTGVPDGMTGGATEIPATEQKPSAQQPQQRIDYLAGLVAVCCIMVTLRHFSLTFWPFVTESQGYTKHFKADKALSYILGPYVLTPLWIGPFFVSLGHKLQVSGTTVFENRQARRRSEQNAPPSTSNAHPGRCFHVAYLLSTFPRAHIEAGMASEVFLNELVEISYLIPNAPPEIINHYCVGVLWTIPVQLQFSFVVLLATVLIKDIKTPWKRFGFYALSILCGWYGSSWSACHWLGLMLADMDITYKWRDCMQAKWYRLYPMLTFATLITLATPLVLLFNSAIFHFSFMGWENAIHPDPTTGRPMFETLPSIWWAYPEYYAPNFAVLIFSVGLQVIVELSVWAQKALSIPMVTFFHPHVMTIYLMHGFVFWSLGATVAVWLSDLSMPYWAILLITAVCCYSVILFFTVLMTPLIEFATKQSSKNIWRWATEEPVPHRPTTAPFSKQLVLGREAGETKAEEAEQARRPSRVA